MELDELAQLAGTDVPTDAGAAFLYAICDEAQRADAVDSEVDDGFARDLVVGGIAKAAMPSRRADQWQALVDLAAWDDLRVLVGTGGRQERSKRPVTPTGSAALVLFVIGCRLAEALVKH